MNSWVKIIGAVIVLWLIYKYFNRDGYTLPIYTTNVRYYPINYYNLVDPHILETVTQGTERHIIKDI